MTVGKLTDALDAVDWNANVDAFLLDRASIEAIAAASTRLAMWAKQFESVDAGNPALCFVREMQVASHHVAALLSLGLYKPAAGAMRTLLEAALYYSYFRTHQAELATLATNHSFFVSKAELLDYHKAHTPKFTELQSALGLISGLDKWYSFVSAVIHGQNPGAWVEHTALKDIKYVKTTLEIAVKTYCEGEQLTHKLFLCTVGRQLWDDFSSPAKKLLLAGLPGDKKTALGLDRA